MNEVRNAKHISIFTGQLSMFQHKDMCNVSSAKRSAHLQFPAQTYLQLIPALLVAERTHAAQRCTDVDVRKHE